MLPQKLTNILTILISLVWTGNVIVGFIRPELRDPMVNAIFAVVVGAIYALGRRTGDGAISDARRRLGELISGDRTDNADTGNEQPARDTDNGTGGERT